MSELEALLEKYEEKKDEEKKFRIMVVDDEPSIGRSLSKVFKNYEVVIANNGPNCLEKISPDIFCIIMDAKMPGMDGFEASCRIHDQFPNIPIIMHTAFHGEHRTADVVSYHFFGYVEKGSDPENLKLQVRNAVELYSNRLKVEEYQRELENKVEERTIELTNALNKLKETQELLIEQDRLITERFIAGGMAHEIRNTLGAAKLRINKILNTAKINENYDKLMSILRLLRSSQNISESSFSTAIQSIRILYESQDLLEKSFQELKVLTDRGLTIANRVMDYSRGKEEDPVLIDFRDIFEELVSVYREGFSEKGIQINLCLQEKLIVYGGYGHFYSIFQNLLLNARDAILDKLSTEGKIDIYGQIEDENIVVEFHDNGIGIPEENIGKIFYPFFSTKPTTGMGLGLSECQKIVRHYGGRIIVESEVPGGSKLKVLFPQKRRPLSGKNKF